MIGQPHRIEHTSVPTTPAKSTGRNISDTPVPGCINGFNTSQKRKKRDNGKNTPTSEEGKLFKVITNVESVLENVLMEIHQARQDNFSFKQDVTGILENLQMKQNVIEESLSNLSNDFVANKNKTISQIEKTNNTISEMQRSSCTSTVKEVKAEINDFRNTFHSRMDMIKNCVQSTENSVTMIKRDLEIKSKTYAEDIEQLQSSNRDVQEPISEMKRNVSYTKDTVYDIERGLSVLSEPDTFTQIKTHAKTDSKDSTKDSSIITIVSENTTEIDPEITFASVVVTDKTPGNTDTTSSMNKRDKSADRNQEANADKEIVNGSTNSILTDRNQVNGHTQNMSKDDSREEERVDDYRKPLVCLIGDSISGQVAASYLGKSTNSFVKKLRAPKIDDIGKYTSEVKGAKVIVIHTGINNLREKESTSTAILNLKEAVSSLEKAAPGTKFLFSKVAPVGERSLEIERNLLNAEAEKTFSVTRDGHVSYIDHSNLADRGSIIKDYYKPDELHLSKDGIYRYTENLKDAIQNALRGKQGTSNDAKRQPTEFLSGRIRHKTSSSEEKRY